MDFSQISEMLDLIEHISKDVNLSRLEYKVWVYAYDKGRSAAKDPETKLHFGNLHHHSSTDIVVIDVYRNQVDLHHINEGALHHKVDLDHSKNISLEDKIMRALDCWRSYYHN